jgi:hypothetical protein
MPIRYLLGVAIALFATALTLAQTRASQPDRGITPVELRSSARPDAAFSNRGVERPWPAFNSTSCAVCLASRPSAAPASSRAARGA